MLHDREKNSMIWSAALDELDELAELDDQKRLFTDGLGSHNRSPILDEDWIVAIATLSNTKIE